MAMYKVAGNLDVHVRNMVQTWNQWVEGDQEVFFISSDGTRVPCSRNIIAFYSKTLANILAETSVGISIGISLPVPCRLINYLVEILTKGEAAVANKRDFSQVKAAAKLIGISLDDLNVGVNKAATDDASVAPVNIKKEIIDDEIFPEAITSQSNVKKRTSVGRPKKILAPRTPHSSLQKSRRTSTSKSVKNVPAEMLLAENNCLENASVNVKKEPQGEPPMVALSKEFETFMKKPDFKEGTKPLMKSGRGKLTEFTGSRKKTPDQSRSAKTVSLNLNQKEKASTTPVTKEQKPTKKNLKHQTLKELKNDMEETFKPVNITDNIGNLVSSAKKPSVSKKVKFAQSKEVLSKSKLVEKKANTKAPVKNNLMRKFMQRKPIKQESNAIQRAVKKQKLLQGKSSVVAGVGSRKSGLIHTKKYKCDHCDLKFVGTASLEKHRLVKHTVIKKEKPEDNVATEYEETEDVAIEYEETEETQCPYCFKQFTEFKRLSAHMMKIHKDEV